MKKSSFGVLSVSKIIGRTRSKITMPPAEPIAQPKPATRPISAGAAISGKSAS